MENTEVIKKEAENQCTNPVETTTVINKEVGANHKPVGFGEGQPRLQHPPAPQPQQQQPTGRSRTSREEKMRKKDDKSVDHVLKALNSLNSTEEKLAAMCKKYADIFDENRKVQLALKQAEKRCCTHQREKEQLQTDHSKAILTRSRLENLCRELQRQNKAIKDESLLKIREEEEKRKDVSAKFQTTLNEITALMQQNNDKNLKLRDDNIDMNAKLKNVCEQYELREQQVEKISKQMQLEAQLADAKLAKAKMEMAAEREIMLRDKQQLLLELSQYQTRCQEFQATEINLRSQISMYDDKYDEFQKALARSNEVFGGFKGEMEKMSKKMCKLEKEVSTWKQRWEGSHKALLEMAEEKQKADQDLSHSNRQLQTLQRLCRTLQGERSSLLAKLKEHPTAEVKKNDTEGEVETNKVDLKQDSLSVCNNGNIDSENTVAPAPTIEVNHQENSIANDDGKATITTNPVTNDCTTESPILNDSVKMDSVAVNGSCLVVDSVTTSTSLIDNSTLGEPDCVVISSEVTASEPSPPDTSPSCKDTVMPIEHGVTTTTVVTEMKDDASTANPAVNIDTNSGSDVCDTTLLVPSHDISQRDSVIVEQNGVQEEKPSGDSSTFQLKNKTSSVDCIKEQPVKKQNNEAKKGKESKRKKKNAQ